MTNEKSNNKYDICIVGGAGHVGLPLAIVFAHKGLRVLIQDINQDAMDKIGRGELPFMEHGADKLLGEVLKAGRLAFSPETADIQKARAVIITIGTPVDEFLNPVHTAIENCLDPLLPYLSDGELLILRSTVFPGTTDWLDKHLKSNGKNLNIAFCPERIAQGKAIEELQSLPQIVSGCDEESVGEAKGLFSLLTDKIIELKPTEAELAKLFTNTWRYIQFSISNQFYQMAVQHDLDFYKIFDAIKYEYPRTQSFCSAGFTAGPCLFKDTMQLAAFTNNSFFLGHAAMLINEGFPNFIVQRLKDKYSLREKTVGILGMAFKANNDDKRESLSYKLKKILEIEAKSVFCSDVYIQEEGFVSAEELVESCDIIILAAAHKEYAKLAIGEGKILVDIWNFYGKGGLF